MAGMPATRKRWRVVAAAIAIALAAAWWLLWPDVTSAALLLDLVDPGSRMRAALPVRVAAIRESDVAVPTRHGDVEGRLHIPDAGASHALLIVPGVHAGGIHEPRLAALSRRVAGAGAAVLTLPLPDLRTYRITPESTDQIEDAITWLSSRKDLAPTGRVGVIGVSFAGGLALVAAGRPGMRERLTAVVSLGGHADLPRAMAYACTGRMPDGSTRTPHDYGVVLALRAAVPHLVPARSSGGARSRGGDVSRRVELRDVRHAARDGRCSRRRAGRRTRCRSPRGRSCITSTPAMSCHSAPACCRSSNNWAAVPVCRRSGRRQRPRPSSSFTGSSTTSSQRRKRIDSWRSSPAPATRTCVRSSRRW